MKQAVLILLLATSFTARAQHEHHMMMQEHPADSTMPVMTHAFSLSLPMNRNGSGTSWMPDETPMYAQMKHSRHWNYMLHGSLFLRYNAQNFNHQDKRGGDSFDAPNWFMGMAQRKIGSRGLLLLRAMLSVDRLTVGGGGYPLLFQSGESWKGQPLVDKQHPHDLFSELAIGYTYQLSKDADLSFYAGYPGEPALGPPAFMHRISSLNNPDATLGHHWQDATHITFGVTTLGFRYKIFKLEASSFTGREPDENRYDLDRPRFDSYSYRLSMNPNRNLSFQVSRGYIKSPESLHPEENISRTTASVLHAITVNENSYLTSTLVWGHNDAGDNHRENSVLLETNFQRERWALYGRYEWIQKSAEELALPRDPHAVFDFTSLTVGLNYQLPDLAKLNTAIGIQATASHVDAALTSVYGKTPLSGEIYLRVIPQRLRMMP